MLLTSRSIAGIVNGWGKGLNWTRVCHVKGCHVGVIALSDPEDQLLYTDLIVDYDLRYDLDTPSVAMQQAVHFMHKAAYTHVILQQASGLPLHTPFLTC